jgi:hypothetical protein
MTTELPRLTRLQVVTRHPDDFVLTDRSTGNQWQHARGLWIRMPPAPEGERLMLKIVAEVNNRQTLFLGMSRLTTAKLHMGQPIPIDIQALAQTSGGKPIQDVILCAGDTDKDVYDELKKYMPQLPPFVEPTP